MTTNVRTVEEKRRLLARHFLLRELDERTLDRIVQYSSVKRLEAGTVVFEQGDPGDCLYGIFQGQVRIFTVGTAGREVLLNILEPGALFGEIALIDDRARTAHASAMTDCELLVMHRHHFLPLLEQDSQLALHMLRVLCTRVRWTSSIIEDTAFLNLPARLAKRFLALAETHGEKLPDGAVRIRLRLSQRQLGTMVNASREAVNKQITVWRAAGVIDLDEGLLIVRRPDWLESIVG